MDEYPVIKTPAEDVWEEEEFEQLYSASIEIIALLSIFYGSISIIAITGNGLVIWVVATAPKMRTVTNMYIANLAFADVIIGVFCIPFQFQAALLQRWNLPWFMCGFCPFVQALSVNVSVFTLTAIAVDRHRAILNPLRVRASKFVSKFIIAFIWLVAFVFAIPCAIAFRVEVVHERIKENGIVHNTTRPFCANINLSEFQLRTYRYTLVFVQYVVPFCVISYVYIQMTINLWGTRHPGNAQDIRDSTWIKNKKKVIKMLIIVVAVFGVCWFPLQVYNVLYVTIPEVNEYHYINIVWFFCDWLAMSNSCYNPFIYGIYNEKFKREFNKRFAFCFFRFKTSLDTHERTLSMHTRASSVRSTYGQTPMRIRNNNFNSSIHSQHRSSVKAGSRHENNAVCNIIAYKVNGNGVVETTTSLLNHFGNAHHVTEISNGNNKSVMLQCQRNNFKPSQPELIEYDGDEEQVLIDEHSINEQTCDLKNGHTILEEKKCDTTVENLISMSSSLSIKTLNTSS